MSKYYTKVNLNTQEIDSLKEIVSELEKEIDILEEPSGIEKIHLSNIRERVFNMISLVASIEEDIQRQVKCLIADYINGLYAELSNIQTYLEILHKKQDGIKNYQEEGEGF